MKSDQPNKKTMKESLRRNVLIVFSTLTVCGILIALLSGNSNAQNGICLFQANFKNITLFYI
jgi:hypothetical protein